MTEYTNVEKPFLEKLRQAHWQVIDQGKATYYISGPGPITEAKDDLSTQPLEISTPPLGTVIKLNIVDIEANTEISTQPLEISTQPFDLRTPPPVDIPNNVLLQIQELNLKQRIHDSEKITEIIKTLCSIRPLTSNEIAHVFGKREDYIRRKYLSKMIKIGELVYLFPEMVNHPEQAYLTPKPL
jgi:ATP-dependent DNA helicase RecG